jgi:biotin synthase
VLDALGTHPGAFERACVQTTSTPHSFEQTLGLVRRLRQCTTVPVDVSVLPPNATALDEVFAAGADHVGFGIDAATPEVFARAKGPGWLHYRRLIARAADRFPGRAAVHLIAGLGENERDLSLAMQEYHDAGVVVGLFAFCPVAGTRMAEAPRPSLASYRRLQVARSLIVANFGRPESFAFDGGGALTGYGSADLTDLRDGQPFQTSGCPGCNRPFYNERPSGPLYNYPRPLTSVEAAEALVESGISELAELARAHA